MSIFQTIHDTKGLIEREVVDECTTVEQYIMRKFGSVDPAVAGLKVVIEGAQAEPVPAEPAPTPAEPAPTPADPVAEGAAEVKAEAEAEAAVLDAEAAAIRAKFYVPG
jgi:hypothetical protein